MSMLSLKDLDLLNDWLQFLRTKILNFYWVGFVCFYFYFYFYFFNLKRLLDLEYCFVYFLGL